MLSDASVPPRPPGQDAAHLVAESLQRSALVSLERGDHEAAERLLRQGLAQVPDHAGCLAALALCLAEGQRRYVTAERLAARAIKVAPGAASGYHALGRIYLLGGRKQQAFRFLMKACSLSPTDPRVASELAVMGRRRPPVIRSLPRGHAVNVILGRTRAFMTDGRHAALVATLIIVTLFSVVTAALSAPDPGTAGETLVRGLARVDSLLAVGASEAAAREAGLLREQCAARPDLTWQVEERWGLALLQSDRLTDAVAHLETALGDAPRAATLHLNLASALMRLGERGRAFAEFQTAVALDPGAWRARVDYGQALATYGQTIAARHELEEGARLCGDCPAAARALAALHIGAGDFAAALPLLERVHAVSPTRAVRKALALARLRTGDANGASELLEPAWPDSLDAQERHLLLEADCVLRVAGRALALVSALSVAPFAAAPVGPAPGGRAEPDPPPGTSPQVEADDPVLWGLAVMVLIETGHDLEALRAVDRAIALDPRQAGYRNNRALVLRRLGRLDDSEEEWRRAVALDSTLVDRHR